MAKHAPPADDQLSLFDRDVVWETWDDPVPEIAGGDELENYLRRHGLRYFQREAVHALFKGWTDPDAPSNHQLLDIATGLGKTTIFCAAIGAWNKSVNGSDRVLVLVHRDFLVGQAAERLAQMLDEHVEIEQADFWASTNARIVVASVDTIKQKRRLQRFPPDHFGLIVIDECHHYLATTYRRPLDYFKDARRLGVTATATRGDKKALGLIFDNVAYVMRVTDGIDAGYLVPVIGHQVTVEEMDMDSLHVVKGEIVQSELDDTILKHVELIVQKTLELYPERRGIAFFPGVRSAELAAERFNALAPGSAGFICAKTPDDERHQVVRDFKAGRLKYLCNVGIATEGFDAPSCSLIIQGRPTLSPTFACQTIGRGTRVLPGLVEHLDGPENAARRRALIAASAKPDCVVLDFVGVGKLAAKLVNAVDVLAGEYSEDEVKKAKALAKKEPGRDTRDYLNQARRELAALAKSMEAKRIKTRESAFDPFGVCGVDMTAEARYAPYHAPARPQQVQALTKLGVDPADLKGLSRRAATRMLEAVNERRKQNLCTLRQLRQLHVRGATTESKIPFPVARCAMDYLKSQDWGRAPSYQPAELQRIVQEGLKNHERKPGAVPTR